MVARRVSELNRSYGTDLDCRWSAFSGIDGNGFDGRQNKNLAITDVSFRSRPGNSHKRIERPIQKVIVDHDFNGDFAKEMDLVFDPSVRCGLAALSTESLRIADGHAIDADGIESIAHRLQFDRLNDGHDHLHFKHSRWNASSQSTVGLGS